MKKNIIFVALLTLIMAFSLAITNCKSDQSMDDQDKPMSDKEEMSK